MLYISIDYHNGTAEAFQTKLAEADAKIVVEGINKNSKVKHAKLTGAKNG